MPVPAIEPDPLLFWFDLCGHDGEFYSSGATGNLMMRVGVHSLDPTDPPQGEVRKSWTGYGSRDKGLARLWTAGVIPFTIADVSPWSEKEYLKLRAVLRKEWHTLVDAHTDRIDRFYKDLTAWTPEEITDFGIVNIFAAPEKIPIYIEDYSSTLGTDEETGVGIRTVTLAMRERSLY